MAVEDSLRFRAFALLGRAWAKIEALFNALLHRLQSQRRQLKAEARIIGAEVLQIGVQLWDKIDDLPIVPASFKLTPIRTQFYGHGAFMGAAPALWADPKWRRILAFLMPDGFEQIRSAMDAGADGHEIMPMMENNPILAAFGVFRSARATHVTEESPHHLSGMEWDMFIDADMIVEWEHARSDLKAL